MSEVNSPTHRNLILTSTDIQLINSIVLRPNRSTLREEARYRDFRKPKTAAKREEELVRITFLTGLRHPEAKSRLLDGIEAKPTISITEMTASLQFRSQALAFASSSRGNKLFTVKEEVQLQKDLSKAK